MSSDAGSGGYVPAPKLTYQYWGRANGGGIIGSVRLATVSEVTAYLEPDGRLGGRLGVWATGRMRKRDGDPGPSRCCLVDLACAQPAWLTAVVADARSRLTGNASRSA